MGDELVVGAWTALIASAPEAGAFLSVRAPDTTVMRLVDQCC